MTVRRIDLRTVLLLSMAGVVGDRTVVSKRQGLCAQCSSVI